MIDQADANEGLGKYEEERLAFWDSAPWYPVQEEEVSDDAF